MFTLRQYVRRQWDVIFLVPLLCASSGCASYTTRDVEITVINAKSGKPEKDVSVTAQYRYMMVANAPRDVQGRTDAEGQLVLPMADFSSGGIALQVGESTFSIDDELVRSGGKASWFRQYNSEEQQPFIVSLAPQESIQSSFPLGMLALVVAGGLVILYLRWRKKGSRVAEAGVREGGTP
jgi:hypothetical protein